MASPRLLQGRISRIGGIYVITTVVCGRRAMLRQQTADRVARELHAFGADPRIDSLGWVVMPDHLHWMFQLQHGALSAVVQALKSRSARGVNQSLGLSGALWQAGYYDRQLRAEEDLLVQARYIVGNPLRKGLVQRVEDYPYWWCRWVTGSKDL